MQSRNEKLWCINTIKTLPVGERSFFFPIPGSGGASFNDPSPLLSFVFFFISLLFRAPLGKKIKKSETLLDPITSISNQSDEI